ncbi:MAG: hypothetical protein HW376_1515 [candidate division NC10 bacterium]|nr:hypothetical protein [candidate division NC10 bacterium]
MLYEELFRGLAAARIRYVVVGGVALVLHGVVRFTADLDLLVALDPENLDAFLEAMEDLGYKSKLPLRAKAFADPQMRAEWKEMRGMQVFTFYHPQRPMELVDVFIDEPIDFAAVQRDKRMTTVLRPAPDSRLP